MRYQRLETPGIRGASSLAAAALFLAACGGGTDTGGVTTPPPPAPTVATVAVTPSTQALVVGDSIHLTATARSANGAVLSGKATSWSSGSATIASVSTAGTVTAVAPGTATIVASVDGVTGTATVSVAARVTIDETREVTRTITVAGDSVTTVTADGTSLTLVVPPGALPDSTPLAITIAPVTAMADLPAHATLLHAVRLQPSGTHFRVPLLLHIQGAVAPPTGEVFFGFTAPDSGGPVTALPARQIPGGAEVMLYHFSLIGLGGDVPEELQDLNTDVTLGLTGAFLGRLTIVLQAGVADNAALDELISIFREWWLQMEPVLHLSGADDQSLVTAITDYSFWTSTEAFAEQQLQLPAGSIAQSPSIKGLLSDLVDLKFGFNAAIVRANAACVLAHDLRQVRVALYWQDQAAQLHLDDAVFEWLTRDWVLAHLCAHVVVTEQTIPQNPVGGVATDVSLRFGVQYTGEPLTIDMVLPLSLTLTGTTNDGSVQDVTDAAGRYTTSLVPTGQAPIEASGQACLPADLVGEDDLCAPFDVVRTIQVTVAVTPDVVTLAPGGTQQFHATVTGNPNTAVTWTATGGSITPTGMYTSPASTGTFAVRATSDADPFAFAEASVTVWNSCGNLPSRYGTYKELDLGVHTVVQFHELDNVPGTINETLNGSGGTSSGTVQDKSVSIIADDPDTRVDIAGNHQLTGVGTTGFTSDFVVFTPSNPALLGTDMTFTLAAHVTAQGTITGDRGRAAWTLVTAGGASHGGSVSTLDGAASDPNGGTYNVDVTSPFGDPVNVQATLSATAGMATHAGEPLPSPGSYTGSARMQVSVQLGITNVRDAAGHPVTASVCSLTGASWLGAP